ncbi:hypothetical protein [Winogradskyella helgolandensis]|uniref:hypothetical protein n=1 Tax=Winogradskyella helgolandensis TaxID=2697010 RepID=UPI0015C91765|nr:hypothetical protein [Winogradskyella helgolandensis]
MKKTVMFFTILILLNTCKMHPESSSTNELSQKEDSGKVDLSKSGLRLKIGPTWYSNESKIHFVYGVSEKNTSDNFITEWHFSFGGNINCQEKALSAIFDFKNSKDLILPDAINKLLPATENSIQRKQENLKVVFDYKNLNPGLLVFTIEKVNLKPNRKQNRVELKIKSDCKEYLNLPIILTKYVAPTVNELVDDYIKNEINSLQISELKTIKVIFSHNQTYKTEHFLVDMVDQRNMQILTYDTLAKEFILTDIEKNVIRKIKHSS